MESKIIRRYYWIMKKREWKALLHNYKSIIIAYSLLIGFFINSFYKLYSANYKVISTYSKYFIGLLSIILILNLIFRKRFPLNIYPSDMLFFSIKNIKEYFIKASLKRQAFLYIVITSILGVIIYRFQPITIVFVLIVSPLFFINLIMGYLKFNGQLNLFTIILYCIALFCSSIIFFFDIGIMILLYVLEIYSIYKLTKYTLAKDIDFDAVYKFSEFNDKIQFYSSHMMLSNMEQITKENLSRKSRKKTFVAQLTKENALFQMNFLSFRRLQLRVLFFLLILLIVSFLIYGFDLLKVYTIGKELKLDLLMLFLSINLFLQNFIFLIIKQYKDLLSKRKQGMLLPYSNKEIFLSFYKLSSPLITIILFLIGVFLNDNLLVVIIITILYCLAFYMQLYFSIRKVSRVRDLLLSLISYILIYILIS